MEEKIKKVSKQFAAKDLKNSKLRRKENNDIINISAFFIKLTLRTKEDYNFSKFFSASEDTFYK